MNQIFLLAPPAPMLLIPKHALSIVLENRRMAKKRHKIATSLRKAERNERNRIFFEYVSAKSTINSILKNTSIPSIATGFRQGSISQSISPSTYCR